MDIGPHDHAVEDVLVDELESNLSKFVHIEDTEETCALDGYNNSDADEGNEELEPLGPEPVKKCLEKHKISSAYSSDKDDKPETALQIPFPEELPCSLTTSLPLVSAMKGSREKVGASPRKLTVKWAPDVYDPIPNSLSHTVKSKQKKYRKDKNKDNNYKRNGKKGQKGSSARGGGGKDKKQFRKLAGRSDKGYKTVDACDRLLPPAGDHEGFDVSSPDYCGSSFLKNSLTNFHYSVAEAL